MTIERRFGNWDEDFGERFGQYPQPQGQNLEDCTGMVDGKPVWRGKVKVNEDGSLSPVAEAPEWSPEDLAFLKEMKVAL